MPRLYQRLGPLLGLGLTLSLGGCGGGSSSGGGPPPGPPPPPPPPSPIEDLINQPPSVGALAILLTDGSVLIQADPNSTLVINGASGAGLFFRLTPDVNGDYEAGTWTEITSPPAGYAPYAGASAVLADGRVLFVGGEYNQNDYSIAPFAPSALTNMSAIYDPPSDTWTMIPPPPGLPYIGDVPSAILPDGRFVFGTKLDTQMWALDPASLAWSQLSSTGKADNFSEEGMTLLPNGNLLTIDMVNTPHAEHYVPSLGQWIDDGLTANLTSPSESPSGIGYGPAPVQVVGGVSYGPGPTGTYFPPGEIGPAILRPDGTVFATGSAAPGMTGHTSIYTPGASLADPGRWSTGPDFPSGDNAGDSSAALLPDGNVLVAGASGALYEFDGLNLSLTVAAPLRNAGPAYVLPLPSGQTLVLVTGSKARLYTPTGAPQAAWAPTISTAPSALTRGGAYTISGTQFNGLSQGASFGDELNSSTNFPIVRITNSASGHVFYARTHDHSTMAVATGSALVSTQFDVPMTAETGAGTLVVVADGIASAPVSVSVN
jgi:hypothetical protein